MTWVELGNAAAVGLGTALMCLFVIWWFNHNPPKE